MAQVKSCTNEKCEAYNEKVNKKENYCSKCGSQLSYVCKNKKCHTFLEETDGTYCISCQAKKDDAKDKRKSIAVKVGTPILGVVGVALAKGKDIIKNIPKTK
ncbi:MAG: hypothetical protein ACI4VI_04380 [Acutalibacteraceae bacterium]